MDNTQKKIQEALTKIDEGLDQINSNKEWLHFLMFQSMFYKYSFNNTILIYMQNPDASYVKGYNAWKNLGRYVRRGERGIAILAPCFKRVDSQKDASPTDAEEKEKGRVLCGFRVCYVYDIQSTDGNDEMLPTLVRGLSGTSEEIQSHLASLRSHVEKTYPIKDTLGTSEKGSFNLATKTISIRSDLDDLQKLKTLIHEYSHALDFEANPIGEGENEKRNQREIIAESCSFVVCHALGLDTKDYSLPYLQTWLNDKDEMKQLASTIQQISSNILNLLIEDSSLQENED